MKTTVFILSLAIVLLACKKKEKEQPTDPVPSSTTTTGSTTSGPSQTSVATVTLTSGTKATIINGSCGWAVAGGVNYIGAKDQANNLRVMEASFNIQSLPSQTTTYSLVAYDVNDTDPTHVNMSFTELVGNGSLSWSSDASSGSLTLVVSGNKVTVNLAGISLKPQTNSGFYTNLNVGEYAKPGALSGTLTFYKQ